jgi:GNAT superfamily N-acetyltransferase
VETSQIRLARPKDLPLVEALEERVQPYRPEDEPAVKAMYARALRAEQANDPRWMPLPISSTRPDASETNPFPGLEAFWVAEQEGEHGLLMGIVGVEAFCTGEVIDSGHPLVEEWRHCGRVAELRRLRVAPEWRRLGLGMRLCETVIAWSRAHPYDMLVVNTTTPQFPARQLYEKLGFREKGVSFIGRYELVWMELKL